MLCINKCLKINIKKLVFFFFIFSQISTTCCASRLYQSLDVVVKKTIATKFRYSEFRETFYQTIKKVERNDWHENTYSHENRIDLRNNFFQGNCYGLGAHLIRSGHSDAFDELTNHMKTNKKVERTWDSQGLPAPLHYVAFFEELEKKKIKSVFWQPLSNLSDLSEGDIISYTTSNVGDQAFLPPCRGQHVMFVLEKLKIKDSFMWFQILDATSYPHGEKDSRIQRRKAGIGIGEIGLELNDEGIPNTLKWSPLKDPLHRKIKMARLCL